MSPLPFHSTGTSIKTNPIAMDTIQSNTVFTNVAETSDGGVFWEGLEKEVSNDVTIESWLGDTRWSKETSDKTAAHPNSRFVIYVPFVRYQQ